MKRLRKTVRILALAYVFGALGAGMARAEEPRSIDECEKIQAADAYNQCLAKFGPTSKLRNLEPERPGDVKASSADAAATAKPLAFKARGAARRHGGPRRHAGGVGRKRASFTVSHRRHR